MPPTADRRIAVVRHPTFMTTFYDIVLQWVRVNAPEVWPAFDVRTLADPDPDWDRTGVLVPWLQDPVQEWSEEAYARADRLAAECDRRGIPVVNRVDRLTNAAKAEASARLRAAGVPTPRAVRVADPGEFRATLLGLTPPLVVREDWGHGRLMLRADTAADARALPLDRFARPVAAEVVDARGPDGLYRKYRTVVAGAAAVTHHLQLSPDWVTRGDGRLTTPAAVAEEAAFVAGPDPNAATLQAARAALGLDVGAVGYRYDRSGRLVVWEFNPYPMFHFSRHRQAFGDPGMHRTLAAVVGHYLTAAGMPVPARLAAGVDYAARPAFRLPPGAIPSPPRPPGLRRRVRARLRAALPGWLVRPAARLRRWAVGAPPPADTPPTAGG